MLVVEALVALVEHALHSESLPVTLAYQSVLQYIGASPGTSRRSVADVLAASAAVGIFSRLKCIPVNVRPEAVVEELAHWSDTSPHGDDPPTAGSARGGWADEGGGVRTRMGFSANRVVSLDAMVVFVAVVCCGSLEERAAAAFWTLDRDGAGYLTLPQLLKLPTLFTAVAAAGCLLLGHTPLTRTPRHDPPGHATPPGTGSEPAPGRGLDDSHKPPSARGAAHTGGRSSRTPPHSARPSPGSREPTSWSAGAGLSRRGAGGDGVWHMLVEGALVGAFQQHCLPAGDGPEGLPARLTADRLTAVVHSAAESLTRALVSSATEKAAAGAAVGPLAGTGSWGDGPPPHEHLHHHTPLHHHHHHHQQQQQNPQPPQSQPQSQPNLRHTHTPTHHASGKSQVKAHPPHHQGTARSGGGSGGGGPVHPSHSVLTLPPAVGRGSSRPDPAAGSPLAPPLLPPSSQPTQSQLTPGVTGVDSGGRDAHRCAVAAPSVGLWGSGSSTMLANTSHEGRNTTSSLPPPPPAPQQQGQQPAAADSWWGAAWSMAASVGQTAAALAGWGSQQQHHYHHRGAMAARGPTLVPTADDGAVGGVSGSYRRADPDLIGTEVQARRGAGSGRTRPWEHIPSSSSSAPAAAAATATTAGVQHLRFDVRAAAQPYLPTPTATTHTVITTAATCSAPSTSRGSSNPPPVPSAADPGWGDCGGSGAGGVRDGVVMGRGQQSAIGMGTGESSVAAVAAVLGIVPGEGDPAVGSAVLSGAEGEARGDNSATATGSGEGGPSGDGGCGLGSGNGIVTAARSSASSGLLGLARWRRAGGGSMGGRGSTLGGGTLARSAAGGAGAGVLSSGREGIQEGSPSNASLASAPARIVPPPSPPLHQPSPGLHLQPHHVPSSTYQGGYAGTTTTTTTITTAHTSPAAAVAAAVASNVSLTLHADAHTTTTADGGCPQLQSRSLSSLLHAPHSLEEAATRAEEAAKAEAAAAASRGGAAAVTAGAAGGRETAGGAPDGRGGGASGVGGPGGRVLPPLQRAIRSGVRQAGVRLFLHCGVCLLSIIALLTADAALVVWIYLDRRQKLSLSMVIVAGTNAGLVLTVLIISIVRSCWMDRNAALEAEAAAHREAGGRGGGGHGGAGGGIPEFLIHNFVAPALRTLGVGRSPGEDVSSPPGRSTGASGGWGSRLKVLWTTIGRVAGFDSLPAAETGDRPDEEQETSGGGRGSGGTLNNWDEGGHGHGHHQGGQPRATMQHPGTPPYGSYGTYGTSYSTLGPDTGAAASGLGGWQAGGFGMRGGTGVGVGGKIRGAGDGEGGGARRGHGGEMPGFGAAAGGAVGLMGPQGRASMGVVGGCGGVGSVSGSVEGGGGGGEGREQGRGVGGEGGGGGMAARQRTRGTVLPGSAHVSAPAMQRRVELAYPAL